MAIYLQLVGLLLILHNAVSTDCPDAWTAFQGSCYLFGHEQKASFVESEHYCSQHFKSHLVHVETKEENYFIKDFVRHFTGVNVYLRTLFDATFKTEHDFWIGLKDDVIDGIWKWSGTDDTAGFFDWYPSEPNGHTKEDCVASVARYDGRWIDTACSSSASYNPICEMRPGDIEIVG